MVIHEPCGEPCSRLSPVRGRTPTHADPLRVAPSRLPRYAPYRQPTPPTCVFPLAWAESSYASAFDQLPGSDRRQPGVGVRFAAMADELVDQLLIGAGVQVRALRSGALNSAHFVASFAHAECGTAVRISVLREPLWRVAVQAAGDGFVAANVDMISPCAAWQERARKRLNRPRSAADVSALRASRARSTSQCELWGARRAQDRSGVRPSRCIPDRVPTPAPTATGG